MKILQAEQTVLQKEISENKLKRLSPNSVRDDYLTDEGNLKMNTNKLLKTLLIAATLLGLLMSAACVSKIEIQSTAGQALVEQGNAYMTCLKEADWECAYAMMSPFNQRLLADAERIAQGVVDIDSLIEKYAPKITGWTFDQAQFSTRDGKTIGSLEGKVIYADGKSGKMSLEFEQDGGAWKVRASDLHTGISLGLGK